MCPYGVEYRPAAQMQTTKKHDHFVSIRYLTASTVPTPYGLPVRVVV